MTCFLFTGGPGVSPGAGVLSGVSRGGSFRRFRKVFGLFRDGFDVFGVFRELPEYREWCVGVRGVVRRSMVGPEKNLVCLWCPELPGVSFQSVGRVFL